MHVNRQLRATRTQKRIDAVLVRLVINAPDRVRADHLIRDASAILRKSGIKASRLELHRRLDELVKKGLLSVVSVAHVSWVSAPSRPGRPSVKSRKKVQKPSRQPPLTGIGSRRVTRRSRRDILAPLADDANLIPPGPTRKRRHAVPKKSVSRDANAQTVFYATDRAVGGRETFNQLASPYYSSNGVPDAKLHFGEATVTFPVTRHRTGKIERPIFGKIDPKKHVVIVRLIHNEQSQFEKGIVAESLRLNSPDVMVFVHGFNNSFTDAILRTAQIAFDTNFPGIVICYSWPSRKRAAAYVADRERIGSSSARLAELLQVVRRKLPHSMIHLVGHSTGTEIIARAVHSMSDVFAEIVLAAPDISRIDYPNLARALQARSRRTTVYTNRKDLAMLASEFIRFARDRIGRRPTEAIAPGIEVIDATELGIDGTLFKHSYAFAKDLVTDLRCALEGLPQLRPRTDRVRIAGGEYFKLRI